MVTFFKNVSIIQSITKTNRYNKFMFEVFQLQQLFENYRIPFTVDRKRSHKVNPIRASTTILDRLLFWQTEQFQN